jgi:hypothetical protein
VTNQRRCSDVWQMKIMNALAKKLETLYTEILNSLLMRFKMIMDKRFKERKLLLQSFLVEKNLNFLQECCAVTIQEILQLVVFFDLPLNFLSEQLNFDNVNLIQFMFEIKKRQLAEPKGEDFFMNMWNLLRN